MGLDQEKIDSLVRHAINAAPNAYNRYSNFPVGAALLTEDDKIFVGVNVENASYGGTICGERSAVVSAVSQGHQKFKAIAVVTELKEGASPCGLCRQFMVEFGDFEVFVADLDGNVYLKTSTCELLPHAFTPHSMDEHKSLIEKK